MAWINRKTISFTDEELNWIEENATNDVHSKNSVHPDFLNVDIAILSGKPFTMEISNLPQETNKIVLRRLLTAHTTDKLGDEVEIQMCEIDPTDELKKTSKSKRKLSFKVSFASEADMLAAIKGLQERRQASDFLVSIKADLKSEGSSKSSDGGASTGDKAAYSENSGSLNHVHQMEQI